MLIDESSTWCDHRELDGGEPYMCVDCGDHTGGNVCPECGASLCKDCEASIQEAFEEDRRNEANL